MSDCWRKKKVPCLVDWSERYFAHPTVKDVTPMTDELLAFVAVVKSTLSPPAS
jgi:hypothetical protein